MLIFCRCEDSESVTVTVVKVETLKWHTDLRVRRLRGAFGSDPDLNL